MVDSKAISKKRRVSFQSDEHHNNSNNNDNDNNNDDDQPYEGLLASLTPNSTSTASTRSVMRHPMPFHNKPTMPCHATVAAKRERAARSSAPRKKSARSPGPARSIARTMDTAAADSFGSIEGATLFHLCDPHFTKRR